MGRWTDNTVCRGGGQGTEPGGHREDMEIRRGQQGSLPGGGTIPII